MTARASVALVVALATACQINQPPSTSPPPACATAPAPGGAVAPTLTLTETDAGRSVAAKTGDVLLIRLSGAAWGAVCSSNGDVLSPLYGSGDDGTSRTGVFRASHAGIAEVVATTGPVPGGAGRPVLRFSVRVTVTSA